MEHFSLWFAFDEEKQMLEETILWLNKHHDIHRRTIVFDIDDTCLFLNNKNNKWHRNEAMHKLYTYALRNHFYIFFVTARPYSRQNHQRTISQLSQMGFAKFNGLFLMPEHAQNIANFKLLVRKRITEEFGMVILLNVGNMWHDVMHTDDLSLSKTLNSCKWIMFRSKREGMVSALQLKLPKSQFC